jgi:hypothetical protein
MLQISGGGLDLFAGPASDLSQLPQMIDGLQLSFFFYESVATGQADGSTVYSRPDGALAFDFRGTAVVAGAFHLEGDTLCSPHDQQIQLHPGMGAPEVALVRLGIQPLDHLVDERIIFMRPRTSASANGSTVGW